MLREYTFAEDQSARFLVRLSSGSGSNPDLLLRGRTSASANNGRERVQQWMHQTAGYSITSSARASNCGGMAMPSTFAVFWLMTNWNFVGC